MADGIVVGGVNPLGGQGAAGPGDVVLGAAFDSIYALFASTLIDLSLVESLADQAMLDQAIQQLNRDMQRQRRQESERNREFVAELEEANAESERS